MTDKKRRKTKGTISEDDIIPILQRYSATTILTLLTEVAQSADVKIDWKTIVKRSSTGISNPREYQLIWRHLAYREPLLEKINGAEPTKIDDDSDLEFELETIPAVSAEVTSQAAACVKVLMPASFSSEPGPQNDSAEIHSLLKTSPTSKTIPSDKEHAVPPSFGKNTTPVSLQKQKALTRPPAEGFEGNETAGSGSENKKRKAEGFEENETAGVGSAVKMRKLWTAEEDTELIAAVQRFGEGNWAAIVKEGFKHDKTASQLSKRWSILKKHQGNSDAGRSSNSIGLAHSERRTNSNAGRSSNSVSLAYSAVLDATRFALDSALKMPMPRSLSVVNAGATKSMTPSKVQNPKLLQEASDLPQEKGNAPPSNKPRRKLKSPPAHKKPPIPSSSVIKAAALAAGGRIVEPSADASLFKAAQAKNAVHISAGCSSTASNGRQLSSSPHSRLIMMPFPVPGNSSLILLNGTMIPSHQKRGSPNVTEKSSVAGAQHNPSSPGNAKKSSGKETSLEVAEGGDETVSDGVQNQDQKGSL